MIYSSLITTKTNSQIPVLTNGKTIESKYNPEREAETLLSQIEKDFYFFVVIGIGSGLFINQLSEKYPDARIIAAEATNEDLEFLKQIPAFNTMQKNKNIKSICIENLYSTLLNEYIPAIYGDAKIIFQRNWSLENPELFEKSKALIQNCISQISADYSVQSHFGKLWQNNILTNLKLMEGFSSKKISINLSKTAVIVGAGPSLNTTIKRILASPENYYVIATDTALNILLKYDITPDAVVSVDGQNLSCNHFINKTDNKTIFILDLCANCNITKKLTELNQIIYFNSNGHPLSEAARNYSINSINSIYTGSGTVTIAALDFAINHGFEKIEVLGADFGYINNQAYARGSYLDSLYYPKSNKVQNAEQKYDNLLFRTELQKVNETKKTTKVLKSYKESLESYIKDKGLSFSLEENIYFINNLNSKSKDFINIMPFDFEKFYNHICNNLENYEKVFLPYIAFLRKNENTKNISFENYVKLAHTSFVSYNK